MMHMPWGDFVLTLALLIVISVVAVIIEQRWSKQTRTGVMLQGLLFGAAVLINMLQPIDLGAGRFMDGRSVMLSLCALFFGPWAAAEAGVLVIVVRLFLGGAGVCMGVLAAVISIGVGLAAFYHLKKRKAIPSTRFLYLFGLVVHLLLFGAMMSRPADLVRSAMWSVAVPMLLLHPLATVLAGKVLAGQQLAYISQLRLQRTRENIHTTMQSIGDGVISTDRQGAVVLMNPAAERITGWLRDEACGRPLSEVYQLQGTGPTRRAGADAQNPGTERGELADSMVLIARDGSTCRVTDSIAPIYDTHGEKLGQVVVFRDVNQEYLNLEALRESEEDYRNLFQDHMAVKLVIDPESGKIIDANRIAVEYYGWPRETLCKMTIQEINQSSPGLVEDEMRRARAAQKTRFEFKHRLADGSLRDVEVYSSLVRIKGGNYLHSIVHDITERKQSEEENRKLQEQLAQAQKMESIGRLAGGVAHDFNNMLLLIIGHTELALDQTGSDQAIHSNLGSNLKANLEQILAAAQRSADLTRQLLAFARKQAIQPKVLDLNQAMAGMLKMLQRLLGENIELLWKPGANLGLVKVDPSQIDQILANLAVNARDAINGAGRVTIETRNVRIGESCNRIHPDCVPGDYVMLLVDDSGVGVNRKDLPHLFEPFFTTKPVGQGTGLGLATVYGIVRQNQGFITVDSEPGEGTTFKIYLPRQHGLGASFDPLVGATLSSGTETVLVVEDEQSILELAATVLTRCGYMVLTACDAEAALVAAQNHPGPIHLLLTDVIMPGMSGLMLKEKIVKIQPQIKILFMSGYPSSAITLYAGQADTPHYLPKPFSVRTLAHKVRQVLDA